MTDAPPVDRSLVDAAVDLVRRAGEITLEYFRSAELGLELKADGTPVTAADKAAERFLRTELGALFPDDSVLGEEEGAAPGTSGRRWIIDPIDGTKAFSHGVPLYSTLLALDDEHGPAVGVIGLPALGEFVAAGRGLGCELNGVPCRVSETPSVSGSYLSTSEFNHWPADMLLAAHRSGVAMRTWGDGFGYALVATGRIDAMVDPSIHLWDIAPCRVVIPEAGGRFTTLAGTTEADPPDAVATNGRIHDELLSIIGR